MESQVRTDRAVTNDSLTISRLPESVSFEEGALLEPLSVAVHAIRRVGVMPGSSCLIIGAGAIGLLCAAAARNAGCKTIVIADVVESRVAFAFDNGLADIGHVVTTKKPSSCEESLGLAKETAQQLNSLQLSSGEAIGRTDYTFECTGVASCVQTAVYVGRSHKFQCNGIS
jgi:L-iditol 2-dehydrogenase